MVDGASATESGLLMLPMMGGIVGASIVSGQLISHTGRYKIYPVLAAPSPPSACGCCPGSKSTVPAGVQHLDAVLGAGIGMVMPVLVLAVQNPYGPPTSARHQRQQLLRQIGGSVGAAIFGTLFANRLTTPCANASPRRGCPLPDPESSPRSSSIAAPALRDGYIQAYATPCRGSSSTGAGAGSHAHRLLPQGETLVSHNAPARRLRRT